MTIYKDHTSGREDASFFFLSFPNSASYISASQAMSTHLDHGVTNILPVLYSLQPASYNLSVSRRLLIDEN